MYDDAVQLLLESWLVLGQMAPYLLFGFLVAGALSVFVSPSWVERNLGGRGLMPVLKASLFGVPLPLCSCGVIPVAASIRRHGASRSATTAFLLSTPQTGVDSIAVTYALLGPVFAVFRPVAALATGLIGGGLIQLFDRRRTSAGADESEPPACTDACCTDDRSHGAVYRAIHYGLITLPRDIGLALLIGVAITGLMTTLVPQDSLASYIGGGFFSILLLIAAGVPVYMCATASVPIAAGLIHMGASPGAALAFLIAGPATNAAAFATVWKVLGRRTALLYLATVVASAVACGLMLDWLFEVAESAVRLTAAHDHGPEAVGWMTHIWGATLLAVLVVSSKPVARLARSKPIGQNEETGPSTGQERLELPVSGMSCSHCAESVQRGLAECEGVETAEVDLAGGLAVVTGSRLDREELVAVVEDLGYQVGLSEQARFRENA